MDINDLVKKSVDGQINKTEQKDEKGNGKHSITLNDKVYKLKLLPFDEGMNLWEHIMRKLLPSVGSGLDRLSHNEVLDGSPTTFTEAMIHLSNNLDGSTFRNFSYVLFDGATVDGEPININAEFSGNYGVWKKLFAFAIKENYSSLFTEGWANGLQDVMALVSPMMAQQDTE